ncbi:MAG: HD domain-containing phosphohydrolase [Dehalococcoidia bacterium]
MRIRETFGLVLWVCTAAVVLGTLALPIAAQIFVVCAWLAVTGITFLIVTRRNLSDTEESLEGAYYRLMRAQDDLITRMAMYSEARDALKSEHLHRVRESATLIAFELGIPIEEARAIGRAAVAHDLGKAAVSDALLGQPGKPTPQEFEAIKKHTLIGEKMLGQSPLFELERQSTRHHHEWWDGNGYPDGLTENNIPLVARITAVADVFDALVTKRPYRDAWPEAEAVAYLRKLSGKQFDPQIVQTFVRLLERGEVRGHRPASTALRDIPREVPQPDGSGSADYSVAAAAAAATAPLRRVRVVATSDDLDEDEAVVARTETPGSY